MGLGAKLPLGKEEPALMSWSLLLSSAWAEVNLLARGEREKTEFRF